LRLGLEKDDVPADQRLGIAGATIPGDRQRNLGCPRRSGRKSCAETLQQTNAARVPYWLASDVRLRGKLEPDSGAREREIHDTDVRRLYPLDAPEDRGVQSNRPSSDANAQAGASSGSPDLVAGAGHDLAGLLACRSVRRSRVATRAGSRPTITRGLGEP
jgi:hypothetical protein